MTDDDVRRRAIDPTASFIVQAPAGSGKTELLIQRYLTLLATVDEPEQIVAITFTRKAAAEMRQRIACALAEAAAGIEPAAPHRAATLELARRALERSAARGWSLPEHAQRMRIETLDALNGRLASRLPTLSGGVSGARIVDDAAALYRAAASRAVDALVDDAELGPRVRRLLPYFDYSLVRLETLIAELLPKREQWLRAFADADETALRYALEGALARLVGEELEHAARLVPCEWRTLLPPLLEHAAAAAPGAIGSAFARGDGVRDGDGALALDRLDVWRAIAELLLTREDQWRRRVDRRLGFGPEHRRERDRLNEILAAVDGDDALRNALARVRRLPDPHYSDEQWQALADLRAVLRRAAAELRVEFAARQAIDFVELALAAQQALGGPDAPSDLLLALDYRIRHILVDEFQDTSHGQLRLLETLTAGWAPGDGRTLFLVGDPMQSIYRFRDADMSLFLKVRRDGIGSVRCEPLTLTRNFRSAPAVIDWINSTFARAFPAADDIGRGEVRFAPSEATRSDSPHAGVVVHAIRSDDEGDEVAAAVDVIERERREHPALRIAVLVQSRAHLGGLQERLRERGLAVNAVEIEPLGERQAVQDLIGLTRALLHPADDVAWLAVLHAPWCGLTWRDLAAVAERRGARSVLETIRDPEVRARLEGEAGARLERLLAVLDSAFAARAGLALADWVERTWRALGGDEWLESDADRRSAEQFFARLAALSRRGDLDDPAALDAALAGPRPEPEPVPGGIEIMTMHRAKGLEFDIVVLLGLGRETRREEQRALYWMERVAADGREDLLMAPLPPPGREDRLTSLIRAADEEREAAERTRLLYVAATRAKERLHLVCRLGADAERPPARSLLGAVWPALAEAFDEGAPLCAAAARPNVIEPVLSRFADGFDVAAAERRAAFDVQGDAPVEVSPAIDDAGRMRPEFEWARWPAMQIGTLVHRRLKRIADDGLDAWSVAAIEASRDELCRELELLGLPPAAAIRAAETVVRALVAVLEDERGRWILGPHDEAASEVELTVVNGGRVERMKLDRTFVDDGVRWIVDFKTGTHEGGELDAFLDAEVERYRPQLERYAAVLRELDQRPIRVGLYFPLIRAFRAWQP